MTDTLVNIPGVGQVSFPATMSDADIETAIKTKILPESTGAARGKEMGEASGVLPYIDNLVRQAANGITFGYADEASAGLRSLLGGKSYTEALAEERAHDKAFSEKNPVASTIANIGGNVAGAAVALPEWATAATPSLLGTTLKLGATGGTLGAIQGFGEGEGGFANRVGEAGAQGAFGALGGAAFPVAGAGAKYLAGTGPGTFISEKVVSPAAAKLADLLESVGSKFETRVAPQSLSAAAPEGGQIASDSLGTRLADTLTGTAENLRGVSERAGDVSRQAALSELARRAAAQKADPEALLARQQQLGDHGVLADLGQQFLSAANGARMNDSSLQALAEQVLGDRAKQYGTILRSAFEGGQSIPSLETAGQQYAHNIENVGNQAYGTMRAAGVNVSPEMQQLLDSSPRAAKALQQVEAAAAENGTVLTDADKYHKVKEALDHQASRAVQSDAYLDPKGIADLSNNYRGAFWQANPAAEMADRAYAHANSLPEYMDLGRRFMQEGTTPGALEVSGETMAGKLGLGSSPFQRDAYDVGVTNAGRSAAGLNPVGLARKLTPEAQDLAQKIQLAKGPQGLADILQSADQVRTFANTRNALTGGSPTGANLRDAGEVGNAVLKIGPEGVTPRIWEHAKDIIQRMELPNEEGMKRMGEILMSPNATENRQNLEAIVKLLEKRAAGSTLRTTAASAAGVQAGRE